MSERKDKRSARIRYFKRFTAHTLHCEGKSLQEIATELNIEKTQVSTLIKEYERCHG